MPSLTSELPRSRETTPGLYRRDGYAWAKQQAEALRKRNAALVMATQSAVAVRLNAALGRDYKIRRGPQRAQSRSR